MSPATAQNPSPQPTPAALWSPAAWQRYLPPDFTQTPSDPHEQQQIVTHLQAVWQAVQTYLPRRAVRRLSGGLEPGEMWGEIVEGTFLFADISGFTALTDRLSALPDGTEQIAAMINGYFSSMLHVVDRSCRQVDRFQQECIDLPYDLLKFGGDAMLFLFSGPDHTRLAVRAARHMQQNMTRVAREATGLGASDLSMHVGVNSGRFLDAHVGTARVMKKIEVGQTLNLTARAEALAGPGQIALGPDTRLAVRNWAATHPTAEGFYLLQSDKEESAPAQFAPLPPAPLEPPATLDELITGLDTLVPYLMPGLLAKIVLDPFAPVVWADLKPVTVLFANLLGVSEMLSATPENDVEEVTAILDRYLGAVSEIVARYDGTFNKMDLAQEGDKLLILFGAPHTHEDDPQRAVRAALEMQEALRPFTDLPTSWGTFSLRLRVGIHSGNVFAGNVGSPERKEYTVMGDTVNLAARIMAAAEPGQILVSHETRRRLDESFACQPPFDLHLKGKTQPVPACTIDGLRQRSFAARRVARHTPLVGRQGEMAVLKAAAGQTLGGEGQVVSVVGDAGIGKSRLVDELAAHAEGLGMRVLRGSCVSYGSAMAYLPWTELLRAFLGWAAQDAPAQRRKKLRAALAAVDPSLTEWAPIVAGVLGLALPETPLTRALDAKLRKERFFDLVGQMLESQARECPLLLIFEDLHWADPISLELLDYVARNLGDSPVLLIGVRRPDGAQPQWDDLPHHRAIDLQELAAQESRILAATLLQIGTLPSELEALILRRAQGNPFYVEEVVHMLRERGYLISENGGYRLAGDVSSIEIPETINGVVMSRIDSLDEGSRTVLRVASVIGRVFAYDPLKAIYPQPISHPALQRRLDTLRRVDLTPLEENEPNLRYVFKHILTQEVAYESLLHARRRDLHGQVALFYETTYAERGLEEYFDFLAYHFGRSIHREKAIEYAIRAGDRARSAFANDTAIRHYARALELLQEQGGKQSARWTEVQFNLAEVYVLVGRYEKARESYRQAMRAAGSEWSAEQRARTLRKIGMTHESQGQYNQTLDLLLQAKTSAQSTPQAAESRQMARILADEGAVHMRKGEYQAATDLIEQALTLLARLPKDLERVRDEGWAYTRLGVIQVHRGDLLQARKFFEKSLELREQAGDLVGVATLHNNLGYIAHHLQGDTETAIQAYQRSLRVSNRIGYRYMMAMTANNLGLAYQTLGDYRQAVAHYRQSLQIRQEMGDQHGIASTYDNLGLAYHQRGDYAKAMEYHHLSLEIKRGQGDAFQIANSLLNIAAVCRDQEHLEEALAFGEEALEIFQEIGGRQFLAENHSLLAEVLLANQTHEAAHRHATLALETALETGSSKDQAIAARVLGEVEIALGIDALPDRLRQSVAQLKEINDRFEMAKSLRSLGQCLKRAGQNAEGATHLARATQIFRDLGAQGELKKM
jgi:predicted ATPase/class 3 adenylate cyclase